MRFEKYVSRYQALCKQYYGKDVSCRDALDDVIRLFNFAKAVSKPIPKDEYEKFLQRGKELNPD